MGIDALPVDAVAAKDGAMRVIVTHRVLILCGVALLSVCLATLTETMFWSAFRTIPWLLFLIVIALDAWLGGFWVGLVSSVMSGVASECALFLPGDDDVIGSTHTTMALLAAGVVISWICTQGRYPAPSIAAAESKIITLTDRARAKRAAGADAGRSAPQRGPLVVIQDLRHHHTVAKLAASEMYGGVKSTVDLPQLKSYLGWALEQIESDIAALDTSISASNEQGEPGSDSNVRRIPKAE